MEADELIPISKGGSATDMANIARAHRCCNNWRRAKPVSAVDGIRRLVLESVGYESPQEFVDAAKRMMKEGDALRPHPVMTTTDW